MANNKIKYLDDLGLARLAEDLEFRHPSTFTGTRAAWAALPTERKELYKIVNFTDDSSDNIGLRHPTIFVGTRAEWYALPQDEKLKYVLVNLTDDLEGEGWFLSNEVIEGDMNPVTSNAVYEYVRDLHGIFVTPYFRLAFNNLEAIYQDDRITEDSQAQVYYKDPDAAKESHIVANTDDGQITFTAATAPVEDIICKVVIIN